MKLILIGALLILSACSPVQRVEVSNSEPTLQSAEDANTKEFTEESFR